MAKLSSGRKAIAISDRSGLQFPYIEMVREWNGAWVHTSEYESKQPQLELKVIGADGIGLAHARPPTRETPQVEKILPINPFWTESGSTYLVVNLPTVSGNNANGINMDADGSNTSNSERIFFTGSSTSAIFQSGSVLRFRTVMEEVGGFSIATLQKADGYNYVGSGAPTSWTDYTNFDAEDFFHVNIGSAATSTANGGGSKASVGPVTITP